MTTLFSQSDDKPKPKHGYDSRYEAWYKVYPRHEGKAAGERAYLKVLIKLRCEGRGGMLFMSEKVREYANCVRQWPEESQKYVPLPASWLNSGRYDDDPSRWCLNIVPEKRDYNAETDIILARRQAEADKLQAQIDLDKQEALDFFDKLGSEALRQYQKVWKDSHNGKLCESPVYFMVWIQQRMKG